MRACLCVRSCSTLAAGVALETRGAGATPADRVTRTAVEAGAGVAAAVTVGAGGTQLAAGGAAPARVALATTCKHTSQQRPLLFIVENHRLASRLNC